MGIRTILAGAALAFAVGACSGDGAGNGAGAATAPAARLATARFEPLPEGPWTTLARRLVGADDLEAAVDTTREVLARGGIATLGDTMLLVPVQGPPSSFSATPLETVHLAMEARRKATAGRLTGAEFAQMLEAFGWPFPDARPTGAADRPLVGGPAPADASAVDADASAARQQARDARLAARDDARDAIDASREAALGELEARRATARAAHRAAAVAHAATPPAGRAGSMARMRAALDDVRAADKAWNEARDAFRATEEAWREQDRASSELARIEEDIARRIGPDYANGERFMAFLAAWVAEAARHPEDPRSFTPLFLAEMARLQAAPVDLAGARPVSPLDEDPPPLRGAPRAAQLKWTLLEMQLFAAAFHRTDIAPARAAVAGLGDLLVPPAHAQGPCSDLKESMGPDLGELHATASAETIGYVLDGALGAIGAAGEAIGNALSATAIVGKIIKLAAFYSDNEVTVAAEPTFVHKPTAGTKLVAFTATAGVSPEDLAEYKRLAGRMSRADQSVRDCLGWAGFPSITDIEDVAKDAETWLIDWSIIEGRGHAYWSLANNDLYIKGVRQATKMKRVSDSSAQAKFVVDILGESAHTGRTRTAWVTVRAEVDAAGMPGLGTLVSAGKGILGLADSLADIASGWIMVMFKPKAEAAVLVEYHCARPTTVHRYVKDSVSDGEGDDGDPCTWVFDTKDDFDKWQAGGD